MKGWRWMGTWLLLLLVCGVCLKTGYSTASAAGADISIEPDMNPVVKGEIFYVMITVTSTEEMSGFEGFFSYDQGVMKYMTGGSVSSGNDNEFSISDTERESSARTLKYSIQFKAHRSGSCTVELKSPYSVYNADGSEKMSVAFDSLNIRVLSKKEARKLKTAGSDHKNHSSGNPPDGNEPSGENGTESGVSEEEKSFGRQEDGMSLEGIEPSPSSTPEGKEEGAALSQEGPLHFLQQTEEPVTGDGQTGGGHALSQGGLSRLLCIAVIIIASVDLVLIGIAFVKMRRQEQEAWEDEDGVNEEFTDTDMPEEGEALEDIERRLEKKRQWLRKDEN